MSEARRIALFGGTFDPVHLGHLRIATAARDAMALDEVRFLPCRISPHKTGSRPADGADRVEMLRRATRGLGWAVIDDFELKRDGVSYSWQTAEAMRERFPSARLFWILGTDQWSALPRWSHPERLAACVEFLVFGRGETPEPRDGSVMHPLSAPHPASSTEIRSAFAAGARSHPWVDPLVAEWIVGKRLYQD